jgi:hypothetical protein
MPNITNIVKVTVNGPKRKRRVRRSSKKKKEFKLGHSSGATPMPLSFPARYEVPHAFQLGTVPQLPPPVHQLPPPAAPVGLTFNFPPQPPPAPPRPISAVGVTVVEDAAVPEVEIPQPRPDLDAIFNNLTGRRHTRSETRNVEERRGGRRVRSVSPMPFR